MHELFTYAHAFAFLGVCALHAFFTKIFDAIFVGIVALVRRDIGGLPARRQLDSPTDLCHGRSDRSGSDVEDVRRSVNTKAAAP